MSSDSVGQEFLGVVFDTQRVMQQTAGELRFLARSFAVVHGEVPLVKDLSFLADQLGKQEVLLRDSHMRKSHQDMVDAQAMSGAILNAALAGVLGKLSEEES